MYGFTLSTPDRCNTFSHRPNYQNLMRHWGRIKEGHAVYHFGKTGPRFVGSIVAGRLVKA